jgi:hypothetical protein
MPKLTRRAALAVLGTGGGLLGVGYVLRNVVPGDVAEPVGVASGMMGSATGMDMSSYMEMFNRHGELRRRVEDIPGGVRTTTESDSPALVAQLQGHVSSMCSHLDDGAEVTCMSQSLPTLFRRASDYQRHISFTATGVVAVETATDPVLTEAIRAHAREVSGFVTDGMPAMMRQMNGMGMGMGS